MQEESSVRTPQAAKAGSRMLDAVRKTGLVLAAACFLCAAGTPPQEAQAFSFSVRGFVGEVARNYQAHRNWTDPAKTPRAKAERVCGDGLGRVFFGGGRAVDWIGECARAKSRAAREEERERSRRGRQRSAFR